MRTNKAIFHDVRLLNLLFGALFIAIFRGIYVDYLLPLMGYQGYELNCTETKDIIICDILTLLPLVFYSVERRISNFFAIMVYIFMYAPAMIAIQYFWGCSYHLDYMLAFMFGMVLFFKASHNKISRKKYYSKVENLSIMYFIIFGFFCALVLLVIFRNNLHLVSFADVYDLREDNADVGKDVPLAGYFQMWCQSFFSPLLMAVGLHRKNLRLILLGTLMSLLIYTATGLKSSIINPFVVVGFYYVMKRYMSNSIALFFPLFISILGVLFMSSSFFTGPVASMAYGVIFMRSVGISAQLAPCYITVFDSHPYTYYSHINIVNKITGMYPFSNPSMGNAVWDAYTGSDVNNANANFWLTDGTAAAGVVGVILISIFFYYLLVFLNKLSNAHEQTVVFAMLIPIVTSATNASIFTTILSSGLLFAIILLRYCKLDVVAKKKNTISTKLQEVVESPIEI